MIFLFSLFRLYDICIKDMLSIDILLMGDYYA